MALEAAGIALLPGGFRQEGCHLRHIARPLHFAAQRAQRIDPAVAQQRHDQLQWLAQVALLRQLRDQERQHIRAPLHQPGLSTISSGTGDPEQA